MENNKKPGNVIITNDVIINHYNDRMMKRMRNSSSTLDVIKPDKKKIANSSNIGYCNDKFNNYEEEDEVTSDVNDYYLEKLPSIDEFLKISKDDQFKKPLSSPNSTRELKKRFFYHNLRMFFILFLSVSHVF